MCTCASVSVVRTANACAVASPQAGGGIAGIVSINRGFSATLARDSAGSLFYFSSYEYLKRKLVRRACGRGRVI